MATIMDGKSLSEKIIQNTAKKIKEKNAQITLAVLLVGKDKASQIYVKNKHKACEKAGILSLKRELPESTPEEKLLSLIKALNSNPMVTGMLVQTPLPKHISAQKVIGAISPQKDADGFHPQNIAKLYLGDFTHAPCTPKAVMDILSEYKIPLEGKNATIIGRSNTVGKPLALMLLEKNATVTICHSKTKNLEEHTLNADILICAVGKKHLVKADMVKEGAAVIDVGINREGGNLYGDVDFAKASKKASYITPVPGGVGPMTVAELIKSTYILWEKYSKRKP